MHNEHVVDVSKFWSDFENVYQNDPYIYPQDVKSKKETTQCAAYTVHQTPIKAKIYLLISLWAKVPTNEPVFEKLHRMTPN